MAFVLKSNLPRLSRESYQGRSIVFWTHSFEGRATGWLHDRFHQCFREVLLHAGGRYALASPIYVLMPDHWHLVWMGWAESSDHWLANRFLRKHLATELRVGALQDRAYDHVLRNEECGRNAFMAACHYVRENPVRAGLVTSGQDWPYLGAMVPGYPGIDPRRSDFWDHYWKLFNRLVESTEPSRLSRAGLQGTNSRTIISTK